jgi:uncharacterized protein
VARRVCLGLAWSALEGEHLGLCFSPESAPRTLPWSGSLVGRPLSELAAMLRHDEPTERVLGLLAVNAVVNGPHNPALARAERLEADAAPHLTVFAHYAAQVRGARVVVIGRYPGLDVLWRNVPYTCIERKPFPDTVRAEHAPSHLRGADFVFVTASSLANHTLPELLAHARGAHVVLMGPSTPWLPELGELGVSALAGVSVEDPAALWAVVSEGGGTRLFERAVRYKLLTL